MIAPRRRNRVADPRDVLSRIAFGLGLLGEQPMRARAYGHAARVLRKFGTGTAAAYESGELGQVRGIGPGILATVGAALRNEPIEALDEILQTVPEDLLEARRVKGLGPVRTRMLWRELGLTSLAEIEYACTENRLSELPGFGPKTRDAIVDSLDALRARAGQARMDRARALADEVAEQLRAAPGVQRVAVVGQVRRGTEVVDHIELLVLGSPPQLEGEIGGVPVTVHGCEDPGYWGAALVRTTGTAAHVELLSARGPLAGADEDAVYRNLGVHPTRPERRQEGVPLVELGRPRPELVCLEDLKGALHNHTTASDGIHSLEQMRAAATALGFEYLGIAEHSASAGYAGGLQPERLLAQIEQIAAMNAEQDGSCHLLAGVESDILKDGQLDYPNQVLAELDVVVASVHNRHRLGHDAMTARFLRAARNPWTDVVGHPTGRLLLGRPPVELDVEALIDACAETGCALELNANPQRLDLHERHCAAAKERGVLVSIAADAHSSAALAHLEFGVTIARRAGLRAEDVLNHLGLWQLEEWLRVRKAQALATAPP
jgi:DNA polymerase (family X)